MQQQFDWKESAIRMGLAGVACMIAGFATHPLDTVKIRLQKEGEIIDTSSRKQKKYYNMIRGTKVIVQEEGALALFKGINACLMREATYSSLRLGLYEPFKQLLGEKDPKTTPVWKKFLSGFLSGSAGSFVANPLDLLKIRQQNKEGVQKLGFISEALLIVKSDGIQGLWKGIVPNITRGAILTATKMTTYDHTKYLIKYYLELQEGLLLYSICSFTTGFILCVATSPMDIIKTRIMSQQIGQQAYSGLIDCAAKTFRNEGFMGFYKGFLPMWARFGPQNIIQFICWEKLRTLAGIRNI